MEKFIKAYWKTLLFFTAVGLLGGFFTGIYLLDSYPAEIQAQLVDEINASGLGFIPVNIFMGVVAAFQSAGYGLVLGALGIFLGKKTGLFRDERAIEKKPLVLSILVSLVGGAVLILSDLLFFGRYSQLIMDSYAEKPSVMYIIATVTYGGVIEEVMLRLFMMSLLAFFIHWIFEKNKETVSTWVFVLANVASAILFAAGHLPATALLLGLTPMIVFRCFLLNGGIGLLFGWLYRKYGLRYSMIAHAGCHIVSKLIWILFV